MGAYAKAEPLYQRALAIIEKALGPEHPDTAVSLNNLAFLYDEIGAYGKAEPLYQRALAIREKALGPEHPDTAQSLNNLAMVYHDLGAYAKAEPLYQRAFAIVAGGSSPEVLWHVQANLADLAAQQQRPSEAIFYGKQAVNTIQSLRGQAASLDKALQKSFLASKASVYRFVAAQLSSHARYAEALETLLLLKQDEVREYLADPGDALRDPVTFTGPEVEWNRAYEDIVARMAPIGAERAALEVQAKLGLSPEETARKKTLDAQAQGLREELDAWLARVRREAHVQDERVGQGAVGPAHIAKVEALQQSLRTLGPGTVALHYLVTDERVQVILTSADAQVGREVSLSAKALNALIDDFRRTLQDRSLDPRPLATRLCALLLAPLDEDLRRFGARTLMLSLDSRLRYIPFAALYDGQHYLIERYRLPMLTAAGAEAPAERRPWEVAGLGLTRAVTVEAGLPPETAHFSALPGVRAELQAIVKTGHSEGVLPGIIELNDAFTEQALKSALTRHYPVLHLATHFRFRPGTADASYLVLGDGHALSLRKLNSQTFDFRAVDLLTLSACETGLGGGRDADGRELESFGALARLKGAQSVLASLWKVEDASTATLMSRFYALHQAGLSKAEALRQAQVELLQGHRKVAPPLGAENRGVVLHNSSAPAGERAHAYVLDPARPYAHPYYWAPFILMGNWL
jgi:CHAT domain-containing protein